ncbi:hypothetical protein LQ327_14330 [Actinomycetospora endophytica]|uniref:Interferon-induced transmembrane protein n=1 Tax=Actinomycetospora endophytica TaxID=2291215 RepID=A0ABS8P8D5_9PSEU|nr:hypothetical protein [Actinomycetospora endophytica]MCD2194547.1 hypothetical protein [Actinomycetospora endophytica]
MTTAAQPQRPSQSVPAVTVEPVALEPAVTPAAVVEPELGPLVVPESELDLRPAVTEPPSARSLRATKDVNGIYHSNAGRSLMWVTFWFVLAAWVVLLGGIAYAGFTN